ncbi:MAG: glutamate--tRNA ligase [Anaerolineales bacterium]
MTKLTSPVRVRFAPSPTGRMHLGSARTALYCVLMARQSGGQFVLRIEDTDQKRYVATAEQELMDGLRWLGLQWDEGPDVGGPYAPYRQSECKAIYQQYAWQLIEQGHAYPCFCSPERLKHIREEQQRHKQPPRYDRTCRHLPLEEARARIDSGESYVIRFKMPTEGQITVTDALRGDITYQNADLDDAVIVKSDGLALYHLAVVVDDHRMKTTHVLRGSEWLPSLPLHVHLYHAFGWQQPEWIHLSVFLKPSGKGKMSKREAADLLKDGQSIFVTDLRDMGYTPEGVLNWIALMGASFDLPDDVMRLDEMIAAFDPSRLTPSPAAINFTKLDHFNGVHIRKLSIPDLAQRIKPFFEKAGYAVDDDTLLALTPLIQERITTLEEAPEMAGFFFTPEVQPTLEDLIPKGLTAAAAAQIALRCLEVLSNLPQIDHATAEEPLRALAEELGYKPGQVFGLLRAAVTGQKISPPLLESMAIIGKTVTLQRIADAAQRLQTE